MSIQHDLSLTLRTRPTQARSRETFDQIMAAAASLLDEKGFDAFTTNLLSERSGIAVRAIYRYFPNKYALVAELARRMTEEWRAELDDNLALADPMNDWREIWCGYLDKFVSAVGRTLGAVAVLQAMRSDPGLRLIDDESNELYVRDVATALRKRSPAIGRAQSEDIANVLLRTTVAVIDTTLGEAPARTKRKIEMLKEMHVALLAQWLEA